MASDLHDTIEQHLAGVKLLLTATRDVPDMPEKARDIIERAGQMLVHAKGEVRSAVMNLRGDGESSAGLEVRLRDMVSSLSGTGKVRFRTLLRGIADGMDAESQNDILLIVREAIANALKHGNASEIAVVGDPCDGGFAIRVANNGRPFDPARAPGAAAGHFGLEGMRRRAERHGFGLTFATEDEWTVVKLEVKS
jgi:signal transduction histidine kinase